MDSHYVLYTNLFTIKDNDASKNKFIDIYFIWLSNIIAYAKLTKNDYCVTFMDEKTYEYIHANQAILIMFRTLYFNILKTTNFMIIPYSQPTSIKMGMLQRYMIDGLLDYTKSIAELHPIYIYLDLDVLIMSDIRTSKFSTVFQDDDKKEKTKLFLNKEMQMIGPNYYGQLMTEDEKNVLIANRVDGFTSGTFGWQNNKSIVMFMHHILSRAFSTEKLFYTVDQPFFNSAIVHYIFREPNNIVMIIMDESKIVSNKIGCHLDSNCLFANFCGEPGNDSFHWNKILHQFISQLIEPKVESQKN